jgi:16S rRNA processing protein RimM
MADAPANPVVVGRIAALYGVRGWVKVFSHTDPRDNILRYQPWLVNINGAWQTLQHVEGRIHQQGIVARLDGYEDRDAATALLGCDIAVRPGQLAALAPGEYYWSELIGLKVITTEGVELGVVEKLLETGSNDVLVVQGERERLLPYLPGSVVMEVDKTAGVMRVDWDPEF